MINNVQGLRANLLNPLLLLGLAAYFLQTSYAAADSNITKKFTIDLVPVNGSTVAGNAYVTLQNNNLILQFETSGLLESTGYEGYVEGYKAGGNEPSLTCAPKNLTTNSFLQYAQSTGVPLFKVPNQVAIATNTAAFNGEDISYALTADEVNMMNKGVFPSRLQRFVIYEQQKLKAFGNELKTPLLIPVSCGDIINMSTSAPAVGVTATGQFVSTQNVDLIIRNMYEFRNAEIDRLNRIGNVPARDLFLKGFDALVQEFSNVVHA